MVITTMSSVRVNQDFDRNKDFEDREVELESESELETERESEIGPELQPENQDVLDEDDLNWSRPQENNENIREKMNCSYFITLLHRMQKYTRDGVYFEWMSFGFMVWYRFRTIQKLPPQYFALFPEKISQVIVANISDYPHRE